MLGAALKLLEITHGTNHSMYKDGLDMINICLQGEYLFKVSESHTIFRATYGQGGLDASSSSSTAHG